MCRFFTQSICVLFGLICNIVFAGNGLFFNVSSTSGVLNITTTIPHHTYALAGIKVNTPGYTLANPGSDCVPNKNGYCLFSVSDVIVKQITITGLQGTTAQVELCLNGIKPLSCQLYNVSTSITQSAYVANESTGISLCPINSTGTFGNCIDASSGNSFNALRGIALNAAKTILYVVDVVANSVFLCPVNSNKTLGTCINSGNSGTSFNFPEDLAFNSTLTTAYVTNFNNSKVLRCPINGNGTFGACSDVNNTGVAFNRPFGIETKTIAGGEVAYVVNQGSSQVLKCPIINNAAFGACVDSGNTGVAFLGPRYITLNPNKTIAYVSNNGNNSVSVCPIDASGNFGACTASGNTGDAFNGPRGIAINSSNVLAYVTNVNSNLVYACPILPNGQFGSCVDSGNTGIAFNAPQGITLITD